MSRVPNVTALGRIAVSPGCHQVVDAQCCRIILSFDSVLDNGGVELGIKIKAQFQKTSDNRRSRVVRLLILHAACYNRGCQLNHAFVQRVLAAFYAFRQSFQSHLVIAHLGKSMTK